MTDLPGVDVDKLDNASSPLGIWIAPTSEFGPFGTAFASLGAVGIVLAPIDIDSPSSRIWAFPLSNDFDPTDTAFAPSYGADFARMKISFPPTGVGFGSGKLAFAPATTMVEVECDAGTRSKRCSGSPRDEPSSKLREDSVGDWQEHTDG